MEIILTLFLDRPYLILPNNLFAWFGLVALTAAIFLLVLVTRQKDFYQDNHPDARKDHIEIKSANGVPILIRGIVLFWILIVAALFLVMQLGVVISNADTLPLPFLAVEPSQPIIMLLASIPWVLAAGLMGIPQAVIIALWSGLLLSLWGTHNPFTILEFGFMAVILSTALRQRYRTRVFILLRQPLVAALVTGLLFFPLTFLFGNILFSNGNLAVRLDYAFTHLRWAVLGFNIQLLIAALAATLIKSMFPGAWGGQPPWLVTPMEKQMDTRYFRTLIPFYIILMIGFIYVTWSVSIRRAKSLVQNTMQHTAQLTTQSIPFFLDTGTNLIRDIAGDDLQTGDLTVLDQQLEENFAGSPFFQELIVVAADADSNIITQFPNQGAGSFIDPEEIVGIQLAQTGVRGQVYSILPLEDSNTGLLTFIEPIPSGDGQISGVLIGRTDIGLNPLTAPVIETLQSLELMEGEGYLLDSSGKILYHTDQSVLLTQYPEDVTASPSFSYKLAPDGTRNLVYSHPAEGRPWTAIIVVPASLYQGYALQTAIPILVLILLATIILGIFVRGQLQNVTGSLVNLAKESARIADGDLDTAFTIESVDEVGQLSRSFEEMRISLKSRMEELNRLLDVSKGISSTLEIGELVQPILDAALTTQANSARIIFTQEALPTASIINKVQTRFGAGPSTEQYSYLDYQVLQLNKERDTIVITNPLRTPMLKFGLGSKPPGALLAFAISNEDLFFGTMWLSYDNPQKVKEDDLSFLKTLAGNAGLAAANARLYLNAEIGRQRLSSILHSTPDPVLVADHRGNLIDINPAASTALGVNVESTEFHLVEDVISDPILIRLLKSTENIDETAEVTLPDNHTYLATRSPIRIESQQVGYVCILRDVTYFKQLDAIKTEFVSTVSHDLRKPLTLMKGYATMLELVGELNDQQNQFVKKIITGVEGMSVLVSDLLDLGRIEAEVGLRLDNVPVHDVIRRVMQELRPHADQKNLTMTMEPSTGTIPLLEADRTLLHQAFKNLLDNAVKFTPRGGSIFVRYSVSQERIVVEFEDTGVGISPVDQKRLFEKFFRSTTQESRKEKGTGLGLAIVKSIAERHGGSVWVDSQLGMGSTFYFAIPIRQG